MVGSGSTSVGNIVVPDGPVTRGVSKIGVAGRTGPACPTIPGVGAVNVDWANPAVPDKAALAAVARQIERLIFRPVKLITLENRFLCQVGLDSLKLVRSTWTRLN